MRCAESWCSGGGGSSASCWRLAAVHALGCCSCPPPPSHEARFPPARPLPRRSPISLPVFPRAQRNVHVPDATATALPPELPPATLRPPHRNPVAAPACAWIASSLRSTKHLRQAHPKRAANAARCGVERAEYQRDPYPPLPPPLHPTFVHRATVLRSPNHRVSSRGPRWQA